MNVDLLAFAFALSVLAAVLFGVVPALQSTQPNLSEDLKDGGRDAASSVRGNRSRAVLVVAQVAFALSVLIVSGLVVRTVIGLEHVPLGMNPDGLLTMRLRFDPPNYTDDGVRFRSVESILDRLASVHGVTAAAAMRSFPVVDGEPVRLFALDGRPATRASDAPWAVEAAIFGDYTRAIGLSLLEGAPGGPTIAPRDGRGAGESRSRAPVLAVAIASRRAHHDARWKGTARRNRHRNRRRRRQCHRRRFGRAGPAAGVSPARIGWIAGGRGIRRPRPAIRPRSPRRFATRFAPRIAIWRPRKCVTRAACWTTRCAPTTSSSRCSPPSPRSGSWSP